MENNDTQAPEEGRSEEIPANVGAMLKAAREERELSIEQIAGELHIDARFLIALEEDHFEECSAPVYTKGYIKQYGQRLGLKYGDLLIEYYRQVEVRDVPMIANRPIQLRDGKQIIQWVIVGLVLGILVVGLGVWYLSLEGPPTEVTFPTEESSDLGINGNEALGLPYLFEQESAPIPDPDPEAAAVLELAVVQAVGSESVVALTVPMEVALDPPSKPTIEVTISFDQDCWVEVTNDSGERFFYDLGSAGTVASFNAQLPLSFFLGNADGIRLEFNERLYPIPADSRRGNLAQFVVAEGV